MTPPKKQKQITTINTTEALSVIREIPGLEKTTLPSLLMWGKKYNFCEKFIGRYRIDKNRLNLFLKEGKL